MKRLLGRIERAFGLADGEGGRALRLVGLIFTMSAALVLLKAAQSGVFLGAYPRTVIPWAFAASAAALASLSLGSVPLAARLGPVKLASLTLGMASLAMVVARTLLWVGIPHVPFVLYVLIEAVCGLLLIQVWSVVSEATNARSAKRLLPMAGVGATTAWTVIGLLVPGLTHLVGASGLLLVAPALMLGCLGLVQAVLRHDLNGESGLVTRRAPVMQEWREGFAFVRSVPLMRVMAALSVMALVSEQLMDYLLMAAAQKRYGAPSAVASFFGTYYGVTSAISLVMLLGASGRALARLGASRSLLLVPMVTVFGALLAALVPGFWPAVVMRASDRVLKQSLWSSASEQTQTPLPVLRRAQARALIRGVIAPAGYALAALAVAALPHDVDVRWLAAATALVCMGMAALIGTRVRRAYQRALLQAVDDRKLDLSAATSAPLDADACRTLGDELRSADPVRAALAAELLRTSDTTRALEELAGGLAHPSPAVRQLVLEGLGRQPAGGRAAIEAIARDDAEAPVRAAALRALRGQSESLATVQRAVDDPDPGVAAAARVSLVSLTSPEGFEDGSALLPLLDDSSPVLSTEALDALGPGAGAVILDRLRELLLAGPLTLRRQALRTAARLRLPPLLGPVLSLLDDPSLAPEAAAGLSSWQGAPNVIEHLLGHPDAAVRERTARMLVHGVQGGRRSPLDRLRVLALLDRELGDVYRLYGILGGLAHDDGTPDWQIEPSFAFLAGEVERRILQVRARVLHLLALVGDARSMRGVEFGLRRTSVAVDAKVAELLEMVLEEPLARKVVPLFDRLSLRERTETARRLELFDEQALEDPLKSLITLNDTHLIGCAAVTYGDRFADRFAPLYERLAPVLPLFERMTFLRSVPLFSELSGEDLRSVAEIVEVVERPAGTVIFRKGDPGEDLYLIARGQVAVRDGKVELNTLGEREFFGELAVLDREPRSADIVCLVDTRLLRIRSADLGELMARRPQICEPIMLVLVRRLRAITQRVTQ